MKKENGKMKVQPNNKMLTNEDIKDIKAVMDRFAPLTKEEQKMFLFMLLHSVFELVHMPKQTTDIQRQIGTYQMLISLLTAPKGDNVPFCGVKDIIFGQVEADYEDLIPLLLGTDVDASEDDDGEYEKN